MRVEAVASDDDIPVRVGDHFRLTHLTLLTTDTPGTWKVVMDLEDLDADAPPPLIDGCRIVNRGDGFYTCKVHFRYWRIGSGICPGRTS